MNALTYEKLSKIVRRFDPSHDSDVLNDAYLATQSEEPKVLIRWAKWRANDERARLKRLRPDYLARRRYVLRVDSPEAMAATPDAKFLREERIEAVREAIRGLSAEQQQLVQMRWYDGLTPDQIAAKLARPRATIYTRLRTLIDRLAASQRLSFLANAL